MKLFPDPTLQMRADTLAERYVLYLLDSAAHPSRWYFLSTLLGLALGAFGWWRTGSAIFALPLALILSSVAQTWYAKVLVRIIERSIQQSSRGGKNHDV